MIRSAVLKQNKFSSEAITLITPNANNKIKTKKRRKNYGKKLHII